VLASLLIGYKILLFLLAAGSLMLLALLRKAASEE